MKISIGSDHRGIDQRQIVSKVIQSLGHTPVDCGTDSTESCDYPDIAKQVCQSILSKSSDQGVLICGTGIGMSIAANKFPGIRAAVCHDVNTATLCRQHNNANVLCLSGGLSEQEFEALINAWINSEFEGDRHQRRIDKIHALECSETQNA